MKGKPLIKLIFYLKFVVWNLLVPFAVVAGGAREHQGAPWRVLLRPPATRHQPEHVFLPDAGPSVLAHFRAVTISINQNPQRVSLSRHVKTCVYTVLNASKCALVLFLNKSMGPTQTDHYFFLKGANNYLSPSQIYITFLVQASLAVTLMAEDQGGGKLQRTNIDRCCSLVKWSLILRQFCCIIQAGFQLRGSGDALALGSWVAGAMHSHQGALLPKLFLLNDDSNFKNTPRSRDYRMTSVLALTQLNLFA